MPEFSAIKSYIERHFELQTGQGRLLPMEGMRGLSAFLVFFVHFDALLGSRAGHSLLRSIFRYLATLGNCGVDVFFALSGFIIYGLLRERPTRYGVYMRRRIARLYPVFTAIFCVYLLLSLAVPAQSRIPAGLLPAFTYLTANFFMLPGIIPIVPMITPAWSLSYELCFYLTLPLLLQSLKILRWPKASRIGFFLLLCASCLGLTAAGLWAHPPFIMFGAGIVLRETVEWRPAWIQSWDLLALAAFVMALALYGARSIPQVAAWCGPVVTNSNFILGVLFLSTGALGHCALGSEGLLAKWFSWDWLRWFGNISYSYYLTHGIILHFVKVLLAIAHVPALLSPVAFLAMGVFSFAATVAGSALVFLAIEKRFSFHRQPARAPWRVEERALPGRRAKAAAA